MAKDKIVWRWMMEEDAEKIDSVSDCVHDSLRS